MIVQASTETAFGTSVKGVEIKLTECEALLIAKMLGQGLAFPPKDGMNTDYAAKDLGGTLKRSLETIVNGR